MFASDKYKRIIHNINNDGKHTAYIFEEVHDDHTVPIIYTQEEDNKIMREYNKTMFILTPKNNGELMSKCLQQDILPVCIVKINYISGIRLGRPLVCLLDTSSTGTMVQKSVCHPERNQPYQNI